MSHLNLIYALQDAYGAEILTDKDFRGLSDWIFERTKTRIEFKTLKRLWGKLTDTLEPRADTLNILSQSLGFKTYDYFRANFGGTQNVRVLQEVSCTDQPPGTWRLVFQKIEWLDFDYVDEPQISYRFMWKNDRDEHILFPQGAFIHSPQMLEELLKTAKEQNLFN